MLTAVDLCCVCLVLEVPNLVFLAVSPEEKESWINALNAAIARAKNRILDEVTARQPKLSITRISGQKFPFTPDFLFVP